MKQGVKPSSAAPKPSSSATALKLSGGVKPASAQPTKPVAKVGGAPPSASKGSASAAGAKGATTAPKGTAAAVTSKGTAAAASKGNAASSSSSSNSAAAAEQIAAAAASAAAEAASAAAAAEAAAARDALGTGRITVVYCESSPQFDVVKGELSVEAVDEELALTFAYPSSQIHLTQSPVKGNDWRTVDWGKLEARTPQGLFTGLLAGGRYFAVVVEDGAEKARYEAAQRERAAAFSAQVAQRAEQEQGSIHLSLESCSCIQGNPCATPECCLDYSGRFENARRVMEERSVRKADLRSAGGGKV